MDTCLTCKGPAGAHGSDSEWDTACIGFLKGRNGELLDLVRDMQPYLSHPDMDCAPFGGPCQCGVKDIEARAAKVIERGGSDADNTR